MVTREPVSPGFELLLLGVFYKCCGTVLRESCVFQIRCVLSNKSWSVLSVTVFVGSELKIFDCPVGIGAHHTTKASCPKLVPPGVEETVLAYQEFDMDTGSTSFHFHFCFYLVSPSVSALS